MSIELKIKQVSLALEADYIKKQEQKLIDHKEKCLMLAAFANDPEVAERYKQYAQNHHFKWASLADHRKGIVADEARSTNIARAYLKGKPYSYAESEGYHSINPPNIKRIAQITYKYGPGRGIFSASTQMLEKQIEKIEQWIKETAKVK